MNHFHWQTTSARCVMVRGCFSKETSAASENEFKDLVALSVICKAAVP